MKIKIYTNSDYYELVQDVNHVLSMYKNDDILDIKYSGSGSPAPYSVDEYSVMIIFK
ncbi:TPA: sporulation protein Cse60 [Clostridioides difficile]|nr:sporulation protein Cse60 [Clostridioides difficile]HBF9108036.1 sporulation protein Cse60 [Clostridioides difficile]